MNYLYFSLMMSALLGVTLLTSCSDNENTFSNNGESGQGGSMARFTISGDYLYTVDNQNLKTFNIETPDQPKYLKEKTKTIGFNIETIFCMDTLLLIGSQDGMHIYNIARPAFPQRLSMTSHIRSCDPVVASGKYAYVTLNSEHSMCGRVSNMLQIYNISDPYKPVLVREVDDLSSPRGLGVDKGQNKLFICDNGLKVYDISNPEKPIWIDDLANTPEANGIDAYDVIPLNGILLLTGRDGFYQFDYSGEHLTLISKISINR